MEDQIKFKIQKNGYGWNLCDSKHDSDWKMMWVLFFLPRARINYVSWQFIFVFLNGIVVNYCKWAFSSYKLHKLGKKIIDPIIF